MFRTRVIITLLVICIVVVAFPRITFAEPSQWMPVGQGIEYREFFLCRVEVDIDHALVEHEPVMSLVDNLVLSENSLGLGGREGTRAEDDYGQQEEMKSAPPSHHQSSPS